MRQCLGEGTSNKQTQSETSNETGISDLVEPQGTSINLREIIKSVGSKKKTEAGTYNLYQEKHMNK